MVAGCSRTLENTQPLLFVDVVSGIVQPPTSLARFGWNSSKGLLCFVTVQRVRKRTFSQMQMGLTVKFKEEMMSLYAFFNGL